MTKQQQQIYAIGALIGIVLIGAAYFFLARPQLAERSANKSAAETAEQGAAALQVTLVDLKRKQEALPEAQAEVDELTKQFPTSYKQDEWIDMVTGAADSTGVKIQSIAPTTPTDATAGAVDPATGLPVAGATPAAPAAPTDPNAAPQVDPATGQPIVAEPTFTLAQSSITLSAEGSTANLNDFVTALERMQRPLLIDTITLSSGEGDAQSSVSIVGKTFLSRPLDAPEVTEETTQP